MNAKSISPYYLEIYKEIQRSSKGQSINEKKRIRFERFLKMARNGDSRPRSNCSDVNERKLGNILVGILKYPEFRDKIEEANPYWFAENISQAAKDSLVYLAMDGKDLTTDLDRRSFRRYTTPGKHYDEYLTNHLMTLAPKWFESVKKQDNRTILLEMARSGASTPKRKSSLHASLTRYLNPRSPFYDKEFAKQIKKINPQFVGRIGQKSSPDRKLQNQTELLSMASEGKPKPHFKSPLGIALNNYMSKGSRVFDKDFREKIQSLRPDWIGVCYRYSKEHRQEELLKLAASGAPKPKNSKSDVEENKMAKRLYQYLRAKSFDQEFCDRLRAIRPDWLPDSLKETKQEEKIPA
ncbi:hypothetical protein [Bdellovibrio sp. BCCA]|uniref:hypothetical protein n=1 Tax=Bdellovibrio sp. BCCA TaxID=3136281 RepID=UPI0030EFBF17